MDGVLDVRWERVSCGEYHLHILAPTGSQGQVVLPLAQPDLILTLNGETVWENGYPLTDRVSARDGLIILDLNAGAYEMAGKHACVP
jgi:hypothetical protein